MELFVTIMFIACIACAHSESAADTFHKIRSPEHLMHDLEGTMDNPQEQMSRDDQDAYFFNLHDFDKNLKLDGLELIQAYLHQDHGDNTSRISDDVLEYSVDYVLLKADLDGDRYLTFPEFKRFASTT